MSSSIAATSVISVSRQTLDQVPLRALTFLRAVGTDANIHGALARVGFTKNDIERGWALLRAVSNSPAAVQPTVHNPVATAMEQVDLWIAPGFTRARAALRHLHPDQEAFVFHNLEVRHGGEAILQVGAFLDRCDALELGTDRKATHKADLAALATLEKRGLTKPERKRLRALVAVVESTAAPLPAENLTPVEERVDQLTQLYAWFQDWADTARTVIKRRDQLIRLGLGKRRSRKVVDEETPVVTPAPPPAVATESNDDASGPASKAA
jgi:hypothetical protein